MLKRLSFISLRPDGTRRLTITVRACSLKPKGYCSTAKVFIIALKKNFGDRLVPEAISKIKKSKNKMINHIFQRKEAKITPEVLLRLIRKTPKEAMKISMLDANQEIAINYVRKAIIKRLGRGKKIFKLSPGFINN